MTSSTHSNSDLELLISVPENQPSSQLSILLLQQAPTSWENDKARYQYIPPSPRDSDKRHPKCVKDEAGDWLFLKLLDRKDRSGLNEDRIIYEWFFHDMVDKGTYVDVGAFAGKPGSNTRFFDECLEWEGLVIDANPTMRARITRNRPYAHRLFFAPTCQSSDKNKTVPFVAFPMPNVGQMGITKSLDGFEQHVVDVPCGPLSPLLETLLEGHVNFLSLDVEGAEALVLQTIDWNKIRVDVMIVDSTTNITTRAQVRQLMHTAGYKLYIDGIHHMDLFVHPLFHKAPPAQFREGYSSDRSQIDFFKFQILEPDDGRPYSSRDAMRSVHFFEERYGYTAPSPRIQAHPNCTSKKDGSWQWFDLDWRQRSRGEEDHTIYQWFFKDMKTKGTYVELGAYTGLEESNTRFFDECLGWNGLLIEGNPSMKQKIIHNRPHAHKLFYAPSCRGGDGVRNETVRFHSAPYANVGLQGVVEAFEENQGQVVHVPCGPLSPVVESLLNGHINFFSLDVEGAEAMVLKTIDWAKVRIDVMIAESVNNQCHTRCRSRYEVRDLMRKAGYKLYVDGIFHSDLYIHPSFAKVPPSQFKEGYSEIHKLQERHFEWQNHFEKNSTISS